MGDQEAAWDTAWDETWAEAVASWKWHKVDGGWQMSGACPRCTHQISHEITIGTYTAADARTLQVAEASAPEPVTVECNCDGQHAGRPDDLHSGCGQRVNLLLRFESTEIVPITYGPATPSDVENEREAQLTASEPLSNVRAAATKWAETIGALTGLIGFGVVLKDPDDIADMLLLWKFFFGVFVLLAVIFAGRAIMLAALAGQGKPSDDFLFTGKRLKEKKLSEAKLAAEQLNYSRKSTVYALVCLILAVGITWFAPQETAEPKPPKVLVTFTSGAPVCGDLALSATGDLSVKTGDKPVVVSDGNVSSINVVTACPKSAEE